MSRLAKKPIIIPEGVDVKKEDGLLVFKGPKGSLTLSILEHLKVRIEEKELWIEPTSTDKQVKANAGTMWSLSRNIVEGLTQGFSKVLEIEGVGFRATMEGKTLVLHLGYVNPVKFEVPEGVTVTVEKNVITVVGTDKDLVGRIAATIRANKKPEPYKGKGIHYRGEVIRRKVGKKAGTTTA